MSNLGKLSETEMEVMQKIWELAAPVTVAELLKIFASKQWKTSTVSTLLKRLIEKGFLTKSLEGKANLYNPTLTLAEFKKYETQSLLSRFYNGNVKSFITALVDDSDLNQNDIAELKEWFRNKEDGKK